jgi:hypothetical protein
MSDTKKCCFVVSQIGDDGSSERNQAEWFLQGIVQPALSSRADFLVERADGIAHPGLIDAQVIHRLLTAELVVADLTGLNPNVFYEIGIRHMAQKPIIHMHEVGQKIPFDVSLYRSIQYSRALPKDLQEARSRLEAAVDMALSADHAVENPVTNARGRLQLEQSATPEQRLMMDTMETLAERLGYLEGHIFPSTLRPDPVDEDIPFYNVGDNVKHQKFGVGIVERVDGNKLTVNFKTAGRKQVVDSFVHWIAVDDS